MKIKNYIWLAFLCWAAMAEAQQDPQYSQFMFNKMYFNPAYAGNQKNLCLSCVYRKQWIGMDRAPQTATLVGHGTILQEKLGLGLALTYDQIGFTNRVDIESSYAYRMALGNQSFLSIGLRASLYYMQIRWDEAVAVNSLDPSLPAAVASKLLPNVGAGVYYQSQYWYVGLSVPHIFRNKIAFSSVNNSGGGGTGLTIEPTFRQHYFFMGGVAFDLNKTVSLQTNTIFKYVEGAPFDMDINLSVIFLKKVLVGLTYRLGDSVDALVRWQVAPQLQISFAYDFSVTPLQQYNAGSLEAMVQYCFSKKTEKVNNPRFF